MEKVKFKEFMFALIITILILQPILQQYIVYFQYFDELLSIVTLPIILLHMLKHREEKKIKLYNFILALSLFATSIIGLYSNIVYGYQTFKYAVSDVLIFNKFFLIYFFSEIYFTDKLENKKFILKIIKIFILFLFIGTIIDYVFQINLTTESRFGLYSNEFLFGNPLGLAAVSVFVLLLFIKFSEQLKSPYVIMIILVLLSTLRWKAIAFVGVFAIMAYYINKKNSVLKFTKLLILGLFAFSIAYSQIEFYFFTSVEETARGQLLVKSIEIAKDYFPIGTGFGTYASYMSSSNYSILYSMYNLSHVYGLSPSYSLFICDSFWPMIIGQFGFLGLGLYILILLMIYLKIQNSYEKDGKYTYIVKMGCLVYLMISSISESSFVNPLSMGLALLLGL